MNFLLISIISLILLVILFLIIRKRTGISFNRVKFQDSDASGVVLYSDKYGICGKPDYVIKERGQLVPMELKPTANKVYDSHLVQLFTYCLLVEENFGVKVNYGIIRNQRGNHQISFGDKERGYIQGIIKTVKKSYQSELNRSHHNPTICKFCRFHKICDQALI